MLLSKALKGKTNGLVIIYECWTKKQAPWEPKEDDIYYFFSGDLALCSSNYQENYQPAVDRHKYGNCFRTKGEAEQALEKVKALLLSLRS